MEIFSFEYKDLKHICKRKKKLINKFGRHFITELIKVFRKLISISPTNKHLSHYIINYMKLYKGIKPILMAEYF